MTETETAQLAELTTFMMAELGTDASGHDDSHIDRVVKLVAHILPTEPDANEFIALAAATLHDTYDDKLFTDSAAQKQRVVEKMQSVGVSETDQQAIFQIIDNMSWSKQFFGQAAPLDLTGQIVQDADRLEAMGAMGTVRTLLFGANKNRVLYDPEILPRDLKNKDEYRSGDRETTINHFDEKLFLVKDYLNTDEAKRIGARRDKVMHDFIDAFKAEWSGDDLI
jgi:uncharacterized protein